MTDIHSHTLPVHSPKTAATGVNDMTASESIGPNNTSKLELQQQEAKQQPGIMRDANSTVALEGNESEEDELSLNHQRGNGLNSGLTASAAGDVGTKNEFANRRSGKVFSEGQYVPPPLDADKSVALESLQGIISTLRTIPPQPDGKKANAQQQRVEIGDGRIDAALGSESSEHAPPTTNKGRGKRRSGLQEGVSFKNLNAEEDSDQQSRHQAIAETEAKLVGSYASPSSSSHVNEDGGSSSQRRRSSSQGLNANYIYGSQQSQQSRRRSANIYSERKTMAPHAQAQAYSQERGRPRRYTTSMAAPPPPAQLGGMGGSRPSSHLPPLAEMDAILGAARKRYTWQSPGSLGYEENWRASTGEPYMPRLSVYGYPDYYSLPLSSQQPLHFQLQSGQPLRRPLFIAHLPQSAVIPLLKSKHLLRGTLHINYRNRSDAYVTSPDLDADIYICGSRDRNRALEGDVVAVRLVDTDKVLREKREKEEAKSIKYGGRATGEVRVRTEEDELPEILCTEVCNVEMERPRYCGVVVAVLERSPGQMFSGTLGLSRPSTVKTREENGGGGGGGKGEEDADEEDERGSRPNEEYSGRGGNRRQSFGAGKENERPRIVWFRPSDKRVPLLAIPVDQAPPGFVENADAFATTLFLASIKRWPITSLHPFGSLERELGKVGNLSVELRALLADHNVVDTPFSNSALACIPLNVTNAQQWQIPDEEEKYRQDLRELSSFTIADDASRQTQAFSARWVANGNLEVGIHIVDAAYFIRPGSALDKEIKSRGIEITLYNKKRIPMVPQQLANGVLNLVPGEDRLTMSVLCTLTPEGEVIETTAEQSIVRTRTRLTLEQCQGVIDGGTLLENCPEKEEVEDGVRRIWQVLKKQRSERIRQGAALIEQERVECTVDEGGRVINCEVKEKLDAERMLEELMLLANFFVAQKISSHLPDQALLISQPPPSSRKRDEFLSICREIDYVDLPLSFADHMLTPKDIMNILSQVSPEQKQGMLTLATKLLEPTHYFCTGTTDISKYQYFANNQPLYTHATDPVGRYADLVVQRQLEAALADKSFTVDREGMSRVAEVCSARERSMHEMRAATHQILICQFLRDRKSPVNCEATVLSFDSDAVEVLVPRYGIEKRLYLDQMPSVEHTKIGGGELKIWWRGEEEHPQVLRILGKVKVKLFAVVGKYPPVVKVELLNPRV
ncbi:uncharacterized protein VTP21DRAFT_7058 [Calcarisporiella thermophila]|uniref:uncharacterized protein n=1 Tax=Calcarisporiella thermophila TaxID=911321 RepID=UPI003743CDC8